MTFVARRSVGRPTIDFVVSSNTENLNLFTAAGSPTEAVDVYCTINSGVIIGGSDTIAALRFGQFPAGSTITVNNYGSIQGSRGFGGSYFGFGSTVVPATAGGDAVDANYLDQKMIVIVNPGAMIGGGGGGGGVGGQGGQGGRGGDGIYTQAHQDGPSYSKGYRDVRVYTSSTWKWNGTTVATASASATSVGPISGYRYYRGSLQESTSDKGGTLSYYSIYRTYTTTHIQTGGTGGAGGLGGIGGHGQGYNNTAPGTAGNAGVAGAAGTNPGNNAGKGGKGGTGGTGGTGGNWGSYGFIGSSGATGAAGDDGNDGDGLLGQFGTSGYAGGAGGRAVVSGGMDFTLINNGGNVYGDIV